MGLLSTKNKSPININSTKKSTFSQINSTFMKSGESVHRTDIIPGVIDSNSKLDNMKNNYKTPKRKKYINKKQNGGEIEVSVFNPIQLSYRTFNYPELDNNDTKFLDLSDFQLDKFIAPNITNTRVQKNYSKDPNLKNLSLEQLLKEEGVHAKITSGYRKGSKTSNGNNSNHSHLDENGHAGAYDLVPTDGNFETLRQEIYGNPRIVEWLKNKNWGILEETSKDVMRKTGATGKHWHFGPDTAAINMSKQNGIEYAKLGIKIRKQQQGGPAYFKQYGIDSNKFINMFNALRNKGLSNQVAFETTWQSNKERPKGYYSFGRKATDINDWANKASKSLTTGLYKAAKDSTNFNEFRQKTFMYNKLPTYTDWLKTGRDQGKQFINKYIKDNNLGQPVAILNNNYESNLV